MREAAGLKGVLDGDGEFVEVERLADEIVGAQLERVFDVVELRVGGDHDDRTGAVVLLDVLKDFETADVGKANVEENEIGEFVVREADARAAVGGVDHVIAPFLTLLAQ